MSDFTIGTENYNTPTGTAGSNVDGEIEMPTEEEQPVTASVEQNAESDAVVAIKCSPVGEEQPRVLMKADFNTIIGIDNYTDAIDPIVGEEQYDTMYRRGKMLRVTFGVIGDPLLLALSDLNQRKCEPPLPEDVITEIARNVNESDIPIGNPSAIILNPKEPLPSADKFVEVVYSSHGIPTLIHYAEDYWQWKGNTYHKVETGAVQSRLLHFLEHAKVEYKSKDDDDDWTTLKAFPITPSNLNSIENLLRRRIFQSAGDATPCWIGGKYGCEMPSSVSDPSQLIFGKSTILNLADMGILPPSPFWLNLAALDFDYDPTALCPQWNDFLDSIFEDDEQSKQTLMEWMGLCLTSITKFQKALFLVGKKRSGKGTIAKILQKIVGHHNVTAQSTSDFAQTFGFESFLGKTLAIVSDARIGRQTYTAGFTEKVLNIVGEDTIKINRKHRDALSVRLLTKLMLLSNEVPHIIDQSGALASRFIFLKFPKSFYGNEDTELEGKLLGELPGILCLAILHLQNLLNRGYFIQPETGKELSQRMTALSSPVGEFAAKLVPYMTQDDIWNKWKACRDIEGLRYGSKNALWNDLESAGYTCDFDMANILVKIRDCYGEAQTRDLRDCSRRFREPGALEEKLDEAIKLGVLRVRIETAGNNKPVQIYSEPVSSANEDDTTRYHDPEPTPSMNGSDAEQNGDVDPDIF